MTGKSASKQIDEIITMHPGWKGELLTDIRRVVIQADPGVTEEIKWRMKNRPEGLAVWSLNGIVCFAEIWKDNIKLLFPKGAYLIDTDALFNSRLKSKDIRAIEFKEGNLVDTPRLAKLIKEAVGLNVTKPKI